MLELCTGSGLFCRICPTIGMSAHSLLAHLKVSATPCYDEYDLRRTKKCLSKAYWWPPGCLHGTVSLLLLFSAVHLHRFPCPYYSKRQVTRWYVFSTELMGRIVSEWYLFSHRGQIFNEVMPSLSKYSLPWSFGLWWIGPVDRKLLIRCSCSLLQIYSLLMDTNLTFFPSVMNSWTKRQVTGLSIYRFYDIHQTLSFQFVWTSNFWFTNVIPESIRDNNQHPKTSTITDSSLQS